MLLSFFTFFLSLIISMVLVILWFTYPVMLESNREKLSPFECGFDPTGSARTPFSLRFFLLAVIFLVFDIEIVLLMPLPLMMTNMPPVESSIVVTVFLLLLLLGTAHEYREGSLDWTE
uniref:NADH-ubiquinone oxidoreductase chain 3 n=1 Tax=Polychaeta sp. TaxID=3061522 RepID=A0AAU8L1J1_9ANNE